jgi:hypothetical protein
MIDPRAEYAVRIARWDEGIARGERRHRRMGNLRLADACVAAVMVWASVRGYVSPFWLAAPAVIFVTLVIAHERVLRHNARAARARGQYVRGLARIDDRWAGSGPDGARFLAAYSIGRDLDLFGHGSLFQLLDTASTEIGEDTLADWLCGAPPLDEVRARQGAVDELRLMLDYRETLALVAAEGTASRTGALGTFAAAAPIAFPDAVRPTLAGLAALNALGVVLWGLGSIPLSVLAGWVLLQQALLLLFRARLAAPLRHLDVVVADLARLKTVLQCIEAQPFRSSRLAGVRAALLAHDVPPSRHIAGLERLVGFLDSCRNQMFAPIALLLLVESQVAIAVARWHARHGRSVDGWLRSVGEMESLSALATYAFEHPADPFPDLVDDGAEFDARGLAHPLLPRAAAVSNDLRIGGGGPQVLVVSGSNMSGKSTLLRAVGINVALARAGAPVRAGSLRLSRLAVGATLRIEDSLQEGLSKFYAEILRIRQILDLARGPIPAVFLLDEILAGTNSADRRTGAEAIVKGLLACGAIGLVTTHDLALTELVSGFGAAAANVHFEDRFEDGRLVFDYRMRPGVITRGNALALMRAVGLIE